MFNYKPDLYQLLYMHSYNNPILKIQGSFIKIIFFVGNVSDSKSIVAKGGLNKNSEQIYFITSDNKTIFLSCLKSIDFYKSHALETLIKINNQNSTIFLCAARLFINIGSGDAIVNHFKTRKIKKLLELSLNQQSNN